MSITINFEIESNEKCDLKSLLEKSLPDWQQAIYQAPKEHSTRIQSKDDFTPFHKILDNWNETLEPLLMTILEDVEAVELSDFNGLTDWFERRLNASYELKNAKIMNSDWMPILNELQNLFSKQLFATLQIFEQLLRVLQQPQNYRNQTLDLEIQAVDFQHYKQLMNSGSPQSLTSTTQKNTDGSSVFWPVFITTGVILLLILLTLFSEQFAAFFKVAMIFGGIFGVLYLLYVFARKFPILAALLVLIGISGCDDE